MDRLLSVGVLVCAGLTGLGAVPASAVAHCYSDGSPNLMAGRFSNEMSTYTDIHVIGDRHNANGTFSSITAPIQAGHTAYGQARICDADFFYASEQWLWWYTPNSYLHVAAGAQQKIGAYHYHCWRDQYQLQCSI